MNIADLLAIITPIASGGPTQGAVGGVVHDSRVVTPGDVYVARRGQRHDGHRYVRDAIAKGAVLVVIEEDPDPAIPDHVAWAKVHNTFEALGLMCAALNGHPSRHMFVIGITGTNGKTTTALLTEAALNYAHWSTGVLGTVVERWPGHEQSTEMTTPEADALQHKLAQMVDAHVRCAIMEVSSHALALHRVTGVDFAVASFTNLTQDHLDFHGDMETYRLAKRSLITRYLNNSSMARGAAIWVDDPVGATFAKDCTTRVIRVGHHARPGVDLWATDVHLTVEGVSAVVHHRDEQTPLSSPLIGRHNLANLLLAIANALLVELPLSQAAEGVATVQNVPGRLQRVPGSAEFHVFVDYAHSPDALTHVLSALRPLTKRRLITVFGCGGERDRSKRPLMAQATVQNSDLVYLTSDNPRREPAHQILADAAIGFDQVSFPRLNGHLTDSRGYFVVPDRREAIGQAIAEATHGDVVLIAGKGHEKVQEINGVQLPFDDVAVASGFLSQQWGAP